MSKAILIILWNHPNKEITYVLFIRRESFYRHTKNKDRQKKCYPLSGNFDFFSKVISFVCENASNVLYRNSRHLFEQYTISFYTFVLNILWNITPFLNVFMINKQKFEIKNAWKSISISNLFDNMIKFG